MVIIGKIFRRNYRHCKEEDQEARNYGRVGRNINHQDYSAASSSSISYITGINSFTDRRTDIHTDKVTDGLTDRHKLIYSNVYNYTNR